MQEEQDTCRICSGPAEPDQPLFYPCKCSGTIRYIHQDCLTTWLAHSKKKTCDLCKHPYSFTKVYAKDMPKSLPLWMLIRQIFRQLVLSIVFCIRSVIVGTMWLAMLPWATIWTWRLYFAMGDSIAWLLSDMPRPDIQMDGLGISGFNVSSLSRNQTVANSTASQSLFSSPVIRSISSDIVSGQIVASMIVLVFIAVFLLREWISQNARPGVFDDEDDGFPRPAVEEEEAPEQPPEPPREPEEPRGNLESFERIMQNGIQNAPAPEQQAAAGPSDKNDNRDELSARSPHKKVRRMDDEPAELRWGAVRREKGKRVERPDRHGLRQRPSHWKRPSVPDIDIAVPQPSMLRRDATMLGRRWRPASPLDVPSDQTQFTFRAPTPDHFTAFDPASYTAESDSAAEMASFSFTAPAVRTPTLDVPTDFAEPSSSSDFHYVSGPGPSGLTGIDGSGSAALPDDLEGLTFAPLPSLPTPPDEMAGSLRRPPLPSVTLPPSLGASPSASAPRSRKDTPLASPSLVTYRAPEELEAGPSDLPDYFDNDSLLEDNGKMDNVRIEAERRVYFAQTPEEGEDEEADAGEVEADDEREVYRWSDQEFENEDEMAEAMGVEFQDFADALEEERRVAEFIAAGPRERARVIRAERAALAAREREQEQQQAQADVDLNANEGEGEMDGALEVIGLRGPFFAVFQSATTVIVILDAGIGVGVWIPFTIGKCTALLSLNPPRLMRIINSPLQLIRLVTDPVVDFIVLRIRQSFVPWALKLASSGLYYAGTAASSLTDESRATQVRSTFEYCRDTGVRVWQSFSTSQEPQTGSSLLDHLLDDNSEIMRRIEPVFAPLGKVIRLRYDGLKAAWLRLATGNGTVEKAFAIVLGYTVLSMLVALYLNILNFGSLKSAGRAVRSAVRQQLIVTKVAAFIIVELVIFPLGCGVMLDLSVIWLMPQGDLRDRLSFFMLAPVTATFYHWVIGTMFMYHFAVLLAGCRAIMRPGSMWFIKDPQDQNFHPIRDILERPTLVQVRKLLVSAVMYGFVVAASVGTVSGVLRLFSGTVLPFRWRAREPLSPVPIDLLFLHFALPYTMHYFRPKKALRQFGIYLWKYLARQLRLTSYMFGGRSPSEEFTPNHWSWRTLFVVSDFQMDDAEAVHDGNFRRVPNSDNVMIAKDVPATAQVNEYGAALDEEEAKWIAAQNAEAEKAKRNVKDDYTIVYIPPHFKYRIVAFIICVWIVGSIMLALSLAFPILLGRSFFRLFIPRQVHDGYSFIAGFYLLWSCWLVANAIDRLDKRRQRRGGDEPRAEWPLYLAKRSLLWIAKSSYMVLFCGFIIPTLLALVVEFYMIQPIRHMLHPVREVRIRIVDMWAMGLLFMQVFLRTMRVNPTSRILRGIDQIRRDGWTHPDPIQATQNVFFPLTAGLLGALLLPPGALWALRQVSSLSIGENFLFVHLYPSIFTMAGLSHGVLLFSKVVASWSQTIRDKEFLVEMRLRNLEPEPTPSQPPPQPQLTATLPVEFLEEDDEY